MPKYRFAARSIELFGVDEPARVVRDLRQDTVERGDQEVDSEAGGDARERGRDAGERVATDALERCRS